MMSNKYFLLQKNDLYNLLVSNAKALTPCLSINFVLNNHSFKQQWTEK